MTTVKHKQVKNQCDLLSHDQQFDQSWRLAKTESRLKSLKEFCYTSIVFCVMLFIMIEAYKFTM